MTEKKKNVAPSDDKLFEVLKKAYKGKGLTSRQISDAAGIKNADFGRGVVRSAMKRLMAEGKVEGVTPTEKMRAKLLYKPKEKPKD